MIFLSTLVPGFISDTYREIDEIRNSIRGCLDVCQQEYEGERESGSPEARYAKLTSCQSTCEEKYGGDLIAAKTKLILPNIGENIENYLEFMDTCVNVDIKDLKAFSESYGIKAFYVADSFTNPPLGIDRYDVTLVKDKTFVQELPNCQSIASAKSGLEGHNCNQVEECFRGQFSYNPSLEYSAMQKACSKKIDSCKEKIDSRFNCGDEGFSLFFGSGIFPFRLSAEAGVDGTPQCLEKVDKLKIRTVLKAKLPSKEVSKLDQKCVSMTIKNYPEGDLMNLFEELGDFDKDLRTRLDDATTEEEFTQVINEKLRELGVKSSEISNPSEAANAKILSPLTKAVLDECAEGSKKSGKEVISASVEPLAEIPKFNAKAEGGKKCFTLANPDKLVECKTSQESLDERISKASEGEIRTASEIIHGCRASGKTKETCNEELQIIADQEKEKGTENYALFLGRQKSLEEAISKGTVDWTASGSRTFQETTGLSALARSNAERYFRPLFGRAPGESPGVEVSTRGYPTLSFLAEYIAGGNNLQIRFEGGETYLVNIDTNKQAILGGIGLNIGEKIKLPPINPSTFSPSSRTTETLEEDGPEYTARVDNVEIFGDVEIVAFEDPETGEEMLQIEFDVDEDAPIYAQEVSIVIFQDEKQIAAITLIADVQKPVRPEKKQLSPALKKAGFLIIIILILGVIGYFLKDKIKNFKLPKIPKRKKKKGPGLFTAIKNKFVSFKLPKIKIKVRKEKKIEILKIKKKTSLGLFAIIKRKFFSFKLPKRKIKIKEPVKKKKKVKESSLTIKINKKLFLWILGVLILGLGIYFLFTSINSSISIGAEVGKTEEIIKLEEVPEIIEKNITAKNVSEAALVIENVTETPKLPLIILLEGEWNVQEILVEERIGACGEKNQGDYMFSIVQDKNNIFITSPRHEFKGMLIDKKLSLKGQIKFGSEIVEINYPGITLSEDCNSFEGKGTTSFDYKEKGIICTGTADISGKRKDPVGCIN